MSVRNVTMADGDRPATTSVTTLYTVPSTALGARITQFSCRNSHASAQTYKVYIIPNGGSADDTNQIVDVTTLLSGYTDTPVEPINYFMQPGDFIQVQNSANDSITFFAAGIEFYNS